MIVKPAKAKPVDEKAAEAFIKGAPDGAGLPAAEDKPKAKHVKKGKKIQITHTLSIELLERVDAAFPKMGMSSRASYINMAITQMLGRGVSFAGDEEA